MKYYVIAGEASGDMHGANLLKGLRSLDGNYDCRCWGGELMEAQQAKLVKHYKSLAFMGFTEVLMNISTIFKNIRFCKEDITAYKPDVLILIDYPGFNLRIAEWAKQQGIKVYYYISPQIWAWKESRIKKIKVSVDKMFVILPFEKDFYKKHNYEAFYQGHPLLDAIANFKNERSHEIEALRNELNTDKRILALLPGSRKQEISAMLPVMLKAANAHPNLQVVIAVAPSQQNDLYYELAGSTPIKLISGKTYALLSIADAALVTSGTATLETALFAVPQVVCYKGGKISYLIAKQLIKIKYISLVNLILDKPAVRELIQDEMNDKDINVELNGLLDVNSTKYKQMKSDYLTLSELLGGQGASLRTAKLMYDFLTSN